MVFLRTLSGQTAVLGGSTASTVADVKSFIEQLEGIPAEDQRLLFAGKLFLLFR